MMNKKNTNNAQIIYEYIKYLKDAKRQHDSTIDGALKLINRFEKDTKY